MSSEVILRLEDLKPFDDQLAGHAYVSDKKGGKKLGKWIFLLVHESHLTIIWFVCRFVEGFGGKAIEAPPYPQRNQFL